MHHLIKRFFCGGGGWGGSTSGSASGSLGIANNFRAKPSNLFLFGGKGGWVRFDFGFGFGFGGHCEQYLHKSGASSHQTVFFGRGGVGEVGGVRLRVRLRVRWASEQFSDKGRCIIAATFFFWRGGLGKFDFGSASGSVVVPSNVCTKPGASSQHANSFFLIGGG